MSHVSVDPTGACIPAAWDRNQSTILPRGLGDFIRSVTRVWESLPYNWGVRSCVGCRSRKNLFITVEAAFSEVSSRSKLSIICVASFASVSAVLFLGTLL